MKTVAWITSILVTVYLIANFGGVFFAMAAGVFQAFNRDFWSIMPVEYQAFLGLVVICFLILFYNIFF